MLVLFTAARHSVAPFIAPKRLQEFEAHNDCHCHARSRSSMSSMVSVN